MNSQFVAALDNDGALALAQRARVAIELLAAPPGPQRISLAFGRVGTINVLGIRWYGWPRPNDNGWSAFASPSRDVLQRIADDILGQCQASRIRVFGGGQN